jgi:hypothetical protein
MVDFKIGMICSYRSYVPRWIIPNGGSAVQALFDNVVVETSSDAERLSSALVAIPVLRNGLKPQVLESPVA